MGKEEHIVDTCRRSFSDDEEEENNSNNNNNGVVPLDFPEERSVTMKSRDSASESHQQSYNDYHHKPIHEAVENNNGGAIENNNDCNILNGNDGTMVNACNESTPADAVKEIGVVKNVVVYEDLNFSSSRHYSDNEENQASMDLTSLLLNTEGKLYGREEEKDLLNEAFNRRTTATLKAHREIVLVTGRSGTGKTALANTLREPVVKKGGYFISGKFDQLQKPEPYATFVTAFTEYTSLVIDKGKETMSSTKEAILNAMGSETRLVIDMIPAIEQIVGPQTEMSSLQQVDAQKRHNSAFCKFIRAICSYNCPLVLFIDDLQWSDPGSVDLLEALVTDEEIEGLMILGTCRHDEISRDHKLSSMLRKVEDDKLALITNVEVKNLSQANTNEFVSNILKMQPSSLLSSVIYKEAKGNIFFVLQLLVNLYENGILYMDAKDSEWRLNEDEMQTIKSCHGVVDLLVDKMIRLPFEIQEMLKVASSIGAVFDEYLLFEVLTMSNIEEVISAAVDLDLITPNGGQHGGYRFYHDKTQQAAYSLIPEHERNAFHLHIGRCLLENLPAEELDMNIFIVVNQLSWGVDLFEDQQEKDNVASLCLRAGEKAASSSDFVTAASYLRFGINLLDKGHWRDQYFLSLDLFNAAVEMEYCKGDFERVDDLVEAVLSNARILRDKIRAYTIQVNSLGARRKLDMANDSGFEILKSLGERFPSNPHKAYLIADLLKTKRMLRKMTDQDLLSLPQMYEWDKIAAMQLLNQVSVYTYFGRADLFPFVGLRMIQLTLKYGLSAISAPAFALYGLLNNAAGDTDEGYRYGQLALVVLDRFKAESWLPRVYTYVYGFIFIWKKPLRFSLDPLRYAHRVGLQTGDIEVSMLAAFLCCSIFFHSGQPLDISRLEVSSYCKLMSDYKQDAILPMTKLVLQMMLNFTGQSRDPLVLTGDAFNEESALKKARESKHATLLNLIYIWKLVLAYYFNDYGLGSDMALASANFEKTTRSTIAVTTRIFYNGLTCLALAQESRNKRHISTAKRALKRLKKIALHCPENYGSKVLLMEAEFATLENKVDSAMLKYDASIEQAKSEGLQHEHALACERAGIALLRSRNSTRGLQYLSRACSLYEEWGAHAKVEQMKKTVLLA